MERRWRRGNVKPFRLLKTPWLVLEKVITLMDPPQIVQLVICSKRTRSVVKAFTARQHYNLHFEALPNLMVSLHARKTYDVFNFTFSEEKLHHHLGYRVAWHNFRRPHLTDQLYIMRNLVAKLMSLYKITFELVELNLDYWVDSHPELIYRWLNSFGDRIQEAKIFGDSVSGPSYQLFLKNFGFSKCAHLNVNSTGFHLERIFPMFPEDLHITQANWVTREYLSSLENCVTVHLEEPNFLSDQFINLFLHCLIRGCNPKLEYIKFNLRREYSGERVLREILTFHDDSERVFRRNGIEQLDEGGHYLQLCSGEIATIFFYPNEENADAEPESIGVVVWRNKEK